MKSVQNDVVFDWGNREHRQAQEWCLAGFVLEIATLDNVGYDLPPSD